MTDRRNFLKLSALASGALGLGLTPSKISAAEPTTSPKRSSTPRAAASLDILILGGTGFTGPEQVEYATARGHKVTLLNRNKTRPDFFKGRVEQLIGDMNGDMSALKGKKFDVVIDNPTTFPAWVRNAAQHLAGNTKHYIFISTISVYPDNNVPNQDESAPTTPMPADLDPYTLRPRERRQVLRRAEDVRREGGAETLSGHQHDHSAWTHRWALRSHRPLHLLAVSHRQGWRGVGTGYAQRLPHTVHRFTHDLAEWTIRMAENRAFGTYQATGPAKPLTIAEMLYGIKAVTTAGAQFTWVPAPFLEEQKIRSWRDMTVWIPPSRSPGFMTRNCAKAIAAGLILFRPPRGDGPRTRSTWNKTRPEAELKAIADGAVGGISATREAEVLTAWKAKKTS